MQQSLQEKREKMGIVQYVYFMSNYFSYFGYCMSCILGEIAVSLIHQRKPIQRANGNPARSRRGGRPTFTCSYHLFSLLLRQLRSIGAKLFFCLKTYTKEKIEEEAVKGWEALGSILSAISGGDSMIVEKCELIER